MSLSYQEIQNLAGEIMDLFRQYCDDWYELWFNDFVYDTIEGLQVVDKYDVLKLNPELNPEILNMNIDSVVENIIEPEYGYDETWLDFVKDEYREERRIRRLFNRIMRRYGLKYKIYFNGWCSILSAYEVENNKVAV